MDLIPNLIIKYRISTSNHWVIVLFLIIFITFTLFFVERESQWIVSLIMQRDDQLLPPYIDFWSTLEVPLLNISMNMWFKIDQNVREKYMR